MGGAFLSEWIDVAKCSPYRVLSDAYLSGWMKLSPLTGGFGTDGAKCSQYAAATYALLQSKTQLVLSSSSSSPREELIRDGGF